MGEPFFSRNINSLLITKSMKYQCVTHESHVPLFNFCVITIKIKQKQLKQIHAQNKSSIPKSMFEFTNSIFLVCVALVLFLGFNLGSKAKSFIQRERKTSEIEKKYENLRSARRDLMVRNVRWPQWSDLLCIPCYISNICTGHVKIRNTRRWSRC